MSNEIITHRRQEQGWLPITVVLALILASAALLLNLVGPGQQTRSEAQSTLQEVAERGTLRVGYEGYPPYTIKDPRTGELSGYSVDLAEYIAREAGWEVEWIETSPDTKIPDLQAGKFDVMTEPIFQTIPRASRVSFSRPYAYFGDAAAIVREGDDRFQEIGDLNREDITIAVRQGYTDQAYAEDNLPRAKVRALKVEDVSQVFLDVMSGKADVALADLEQVKAFAREHETEVDAMFTDPAPAYIPAGLMLKQGDFTFYNFLNSALRYAETNGILDTLRDRYAVSAEQSPPQR